MDGTVLDAEGRPLTGDRPARLEDAGVFAPLLREADLREIEASLGVPAAEALERSLEASQSASVLAYGGRPAAMYGIAVLPARPEIGVPWMMGTPEIYQHRVDFMRRSYEVVAGWQRQFPILTNYTDKRHTAAHRWLRQLGFTISPREVPWGAAELPFYEFAKVATHVSD